MREAFLQKKTLNAFCLCFLIPTALAIHTRAEDIPFGAQLKIGVTLHLSGEWAREGNGMLEGALLAAEEINKLGGVKGHPFELVVEDNQSKGPQTAAVAKKLLDIDKVHAALISSMTEVNVCGSDFQSHKVPLITLWDSSPDLEKLGDYIFGIGPWTPSSGERLAIFAYSKLHAKSAVVFRSNSKWSTSVASFFSNKFKSLGGQVKEEIAVNPDERDFRGLLAKLQLLKPDAIYSSIEYNISGFLRQLANQKVKVPLLYSDLLTKDILSAAGPIPVDIYQTQTANPEAPVTKHLTDLYHTKYRKEPELLSFNAWGYDGVMLIAEACRRSSCAPVEINKALHGIQDYPGASAKITFNAVGSSPLEESIFQIRNGEFKLVER